MLDLLIILLILVMVCVGWYCRKILQQAKKTEENLFKTLEEHAAQRTESFSTLEKKLTDFNDIYQKNVQQMQDELNQMLTVTDKKFAELSRQQKELQQKNETLLTEKIVQVSGLVETSAKQNGTAFAEINKKFTELSKRQKEQSVKSDFLSDRCTELSEHLAELKKGSADNFKLIWTDFRNVRQMFQEKFSFNEDRLNLILREINEQQKGLRQLAETQTKNDLKQTRHIEDIRNLFELRLAGLLSTLQLLESELKEVQKADNPAKKTDRTSSEESGKIIHSPNGDKIHFYKQSDGRTISKTYRDEKLCFEIVHSEWGVPEKGIMYSDAGEVLKTFEYDSNGQVK